MAVDTWTLEVRDKVGLGGAAAGCGELRSSARVATVTRIATMQSSAVVSSCERDVGVTRDRLVVARAQPAACARRRRLVVRMTAPTAPDRADRTSQG